VAIRLGRAQISYRDVLLGGRGVWGHTELAFLRGATFMSPKGAWQRSFLSEKAAGRYLARSVEISHSYNDGMEYFLKSGGERVGKLNPKSFWVRKLIQSQEEKNAELRRNSQDDDGSCHDG